jgi:hypothetical protein
MPTASELKLFQVLAGDSVDVEAFQRDPGNQYPTPAAQVAHASGAERNDDRRSHRHSSRNGDTSSALTHSPREQNRSEYNEFDAHRDPHDGHPPAQYQRSDGTNGTSQEGRSQSYDDYKQSFGNSIADKRAALYELRQLTQLHPELKVPGSREFTMDDDMSSVIYEIERLRSVLDIQSNLGLLTSGLSFGVLGLEVLSSKLKLFSLDGWSNDVNKNMSSFRPVLLKIYRRVFRKGIGSVNPFLELTLALVTSAFTYNRKRNALNSMPQAANYQPSVAQNQYTQPNQPNHSHAGQAGQAQYPSGGMQFNDFDSDDEMEGPSTSAQPSMMGAPPTSGTGNGLMSSLLPMLMGGM